MKSDRRPDPRTRVRRTAAAGIALALFLAGLSIVGPVLISSELRVLLFFTSHRARWSADSAKTVTVAGNASVLLVFGVIGAIALWTWKHRVALALTPLASLLIAAVVTKIGKAAIGRARPPLALHFNLVAAGGNSTPSGHTTDSTALFVSLALVIVMLAWRRPIVTRVVSALAVLLSVGIGLSRLELGVHWPLDVVLGWILGLGIAVVAVEIGAAIDRRQPDRPPFDREVRSDLPSVERESIRR